MRVIVNFTVRGVVEPPDPSVEVGEIRKYGPLAARLEITNVQVFPRMSLGRGACSRLIRR